MVEWLQHFLRQESNNRRMAYGLAIAGHVIIALVLLLGFFERTEPASIAAMPVEIVMDLHHLLLAGLPAHSDLPRTTDIIRLTRLVRFVPQADIAGAA